MKQKEREKYFGYGVRCANCKWYKCDNCDLGNDLYEICTDFFEVDP